MPTAYILVRHTLVRYAFAQDFCPADVFWAAYSTPEAAARGLAQAKGQLPNEEFVILEREVLS